MKQKIPYCITLAVATALVPLRIIVVLDIMGGFIAAIGVGIGWYAVKEMDIQWFCYAGMICAVNGIFDVVRAISPLVRPEERAMLTDLVYGSVIVGLPIILL